MSDRLGDRTTAVITGASGLVISVAYILKARAIEDSLLADPVGAAGVPVAVGALLAVASIGLLVKAAIARPKALPSVATTPEDKSGSVQTEARPHLLAFGLLLLLSAYLLALPWLGYVVSIGLLASSIAWLSGGRRPKVLLGFAICTGPLLWLLFDFALRIRLPAGFWRSLI